MQGTENNNGNFLVNGYTYIAGVVAWSFKDKLPEDGQQIVLHDKKEGTQQYIRFNAEFDFTTEELEWYSWHPVAE